MSEERQLVRARRTLLLGTPLLGLLLAPWMIELEQGSGLWLLFRWRGAVEPPASVAVVGVDMVTERELGRPMPRSAHADVIDALSQAGAYPIVLDITMPEETEHDALLADAMHRADSVILAAILERERGIADVQTLQRPTERVASAAMGVAPWIVPDDYPVVYQAIQRDDGDRPTMPLAALQAFVLEDFRTLLYQVRPGIEIDYLPLPPDSSAAFTPLEQEMVGLTRTFADDSALGPDMLAAGSGLPWLAVLIDVYTRGERFGANEFHLNYYGPPRTIPTTPYLQVLRNAGSGELVEQFAGKAVFVGFSGRDQTEQRDNKPFVFSRSGFDISGVEMAATTFANLLEGSYIKPVPQPWLAVLVVFWGVLLACGMSRFGIRHGLTIGLALCSGYLVLAQFLFRLDSYWLPLVIPGLQFVFAAAMLIYIRQLFSESQLTVAMGEEGAQALIGIGKAEKVDFRIMLFADERGSKKRLLREEAELTLERRRELQRDFARVRDLPVMANGGQIHHEVGDSMLAYWVTGDTAVNLAADSFNAACRAALSMHAQIAEWNQEHPRYSIELRMGLDWGQMYSHLNPSPHNKLWTMTGSAIHTAERLESLNKILGTSTLVTGAIAERIDSSQFHVFDLGTFIFCDDTGDTVAGPVSVHELRTAAAATEVDALTSYAFRDTLTKLREGKWAEAMERFDALASQGQHHSALASSYAGWCRQTLAEEVPVWGGVVMVTFSDKSQYMDRYIES